MLSSSRRHAVCIAFGLAFAAFGSGCATTTAAETAKGQWYEVRTQRFRVWTDGDPEHARVLVRDLERFHQVMLSKTTAEEREAAPPLRIFVAKDRTSFAALTQTDNLGIFRPTYRGNYALVDATALSSEGTNSRGRHVLFHEYTHYMMSSSGARVPSWYDEGFAEYMATTEFREDGSYTLGCPPKYRVQRPLRWVGIGRIMDAASADELADRENENARTAREQVDAYAQSWYAVHYFNQTSERQAQLAEYLKLMAGGAASADAVETATSLDYAALDRAILEHATRRRVRCASVHPKAPWLEVSVEVRPLSEAQAHFLVGDLLLASFGPTDEAMKLLEQAAVLQSKAHEPLVALARAHWSKAEQGGSAAASEAVQAQTEVDQARRLAPTDPEALAVEGHLRRLQAQVLKQNGAEGVSEQILLARSAYRSAIKGDEALAEAYYGLGLTYLIEDNGSEEGQAAFEVAAFLLPLEGSIGLYLGQLHLQRGNALQAIPPLEYALRWSKDPKTRAQTQKTIDSIRVATAGQDPDADAAAAQSSTPQPTSPQ